MIMQTKRRCVHIFPRFENNNVIEEIRSKYDNLYGLIEPHITLVFPFESDLSAGEMKSAVESAIGNLKPFKLRAEGFEAIQSHGFYLFLKNH